LRKPRRGVGLVSLAMKYNGARQDVLKSEPVNSFKICKKTESSLRSRPEMQCYLVAAAMHKTRPSYSPANGHKPQKLRGWSNTRSTPAAAMEAQVRDVTVTSQLQRIEGVGVLQHAGGRSAAQFRSVTGHRNSWVGAAHVRRRSATVRWEFLVLLLQF
jgi:hypothetical protein